MNQKYIHGHSVEEQERLEIQHRLVGGASFLPPLTLEMKKVLDVGCGTGVIARDIASQFHQGVVIGIDLQIEQISTAKRLASQKRLSNINFQVGDVTH